LPVRDSEWQEYEASLSQVRGVGRGSNVNFIRNCDKTITFSWIAEFSGQMPFFLSLNQPEDRHPRVPGLFFAMAGGINTHSSTHIKSPCKEPKNSGLSSPPG
jgi:hypothetical protein